MSLDLDNWVIAPGTERFLPFREDADEEAAAVESLGDREPPPDNPSFFEAIGAKKEIDDETSETSSYKSSDDERPDCKQPPNLDELGGVDKVLVSFSTAIESFILGFEFDRVRSLCRLPKRLKNRRMENLGLKKAGKRTTSR
jgi:hypothetical protein